MKRQFAFAMLLALACNANGPAATRPEPHVAAARVLTDSYTASRFNAWHIRAEAAGTDCSVLLLQSEIIMDDSTIEAMHYGAGSYKTVRGGMQQFVREHAFRGVAYKDVSGRIWTYGNVSPSEAERLVSCH